MDLFIYLFGTIFRRRKASITNFRRDTFPLSIIEDNPQYEAGCSESRLKHDWAQTSRETKDLAETGYPVISSLLLKHQKVIGEGAFGKVHLALLHLPDSNMADILVAVIVSSCSTLVGC